MACHEYANEAGEQPIGWIPVTLVAKDDDAEPTGDCQQPVARRSMTAPSTSGARGGGVGGGNDEQHHRRPSEEFDDFDDDDDAAGSGWITENSDDGDNLHASAHQRQWPAQAVPLSSDADAPAADTDMDWRPSVGGPTDGLLPPLTRASSGMEGSRSLPFICVSAPPGDGHSAPFGDAQPWPLQNPQQASPPKMQAAALVLPLGSVSPRISGYVTPHSPGSGYVSPASHPCSPTQGFYVPADGYQPQAHGGCPAQPTSPMSQHCSPMSQHCSPMSQHRSPVAALPSFSPHASMHFPMHSQMHAQTPPFFPTQQNVMLHPGMSGVFSMGSGDGSPGGCSVASGVRDHTPRMGSRQGFDMECLPLWSSWGSSASASPSAGDGHGPSPHAGSGSISPRPSRGNRNPSPSASSARGEASLKAPVVPLKIPSGATTPSRFSAAQHAPAALAVADIALAIDEHGGADAMRGKMRTLCFDKLGSRVLQRVLEDSNVQDVRTLAQELSGSLPDAVQSPHANYVIQQVLELLPTEDVSFLIAELANIVIAVSRHRYGCRIVCRVIQHHCNTWCPVVHAIISEILAGAEQLVRHEFGHHVLSALVEHGTPEHAATIAYVVGHGATSLGSTAKHRHGTYVIEKLLKHAPRHVSEPIARDLIASPEFKAMCMSQGGKHIVRALAKLIEDGKALVVKALDQHLCELVDSKWGKAVAVELGMVPSRVKAPTVEPGMVSPSIGGN